VSELRELKYDSAFSILRITIDVSGGGPYVRLYRLRVLLGASDSEVGFNKALRDGVDKLRLQMAKIVFALPPQ
jgi:hypothetical protein